MFYFIFSAGMLLLGLLVHKAKLYFLISGYNTYSKEKKENVDIVSTAKLMGYYGYLNAVLFFLVGALEYSGVKIGMIPPLVFMMISTVFLIWKIQKYDGNMHDEDGQMNKKSKMQSILVIFSIIGTFLFVGVILFSSSRDTSVILQDQGIEIKGIYGDYYDWSSMEELTILEELPKITLRTNGSALGTKLKGHFRMDEFGSVKLFIDKSVKSYIYFESGGKKVIFNLGNQDKTVAFYEKMVDAK